MLQWRSPNSLCHLWKKQVIFPWKFALTFSIMIHNCCSSKTLYTLIKRIPLKRNFENYKFWIKIHQISKHKSVPLQILHHSLVSNIIYFQQKSHIKVEIFRLATAGIKIHQIHVIFEMKSQFFFKLCNILQSHET